jgi:hypothetical protein
MKRSKSVLLVDFWDANSALVSKGQDRPPMSCDPVLKRAEQVKCLKLLDLTGDLARQLLTVR